MTEDEFRRPYLRFHEYGKSCWNCEHVRVGRMPNRPNRICVKHLGQHIYGGSPVDEFVDNGKIVAEECNDFERYSIGADTWRKDALDELTQIADATSFLSAFWPRAKMARHLCEIEELPEVLKVHIDSLGLYEECGIILRNIKIAEKLI